MSLVDQKTTKNKVKYESSNLTNCKQIMLRILVFMTFAVFATCCGLIAKVNIIKDFCYYNFNFPLIPYYCIYIKSKTKQSSVKYNNNNLLLVKVF